MKSWDDVRPDRLAFPIGGKVYTVRDLPYQSMLTIQKARAGEPSDLDSADGDATWRLVMGATYDEMVADNVPGEALLRAGYATLAFFEGGPEIAESIWESGVDPKALEAALSAALAAKAEPKPPSSMAAATGTPTRASSSGTSSRRASSTRAKKADSPS